MNPALDSANWSRTASTVNLEMGIPRVVRAYGEINRMIDSILLGIAIRTPTYSPPPASTIEEISVSLGGIVTRLPVSLVDELPILLLIVLRADLFPYYFRALAFGSVDCKTQSPDSANTLPGQPTK